MANAAGLGAHRRYRHGVPGKSRSTVAALARQPATLKQRERTILGKVRAELGVEHAALSPILEPTRKWRAVCVCGSSFVHPHRWAAVAALLDHVGGTVLGQEQEPA